MPNDIFTDMAALELCETGLLNTTQKVAVTVRKPLTTFKIGEYRRSFKDDGDRNITVVSVD